MDDFRNIAKQLNNYSNRKTRMNDLTRELRAQFLEFYKSFLNLFDKSNVGNILDEIRGYTFMNEWLEDIFLTFVQYSINTFYDMHVPGYVDNSIDALLKREMYKEYILLACSEIETVMYVDAKQLCESKKFQEKNRELGKTWLTRLQKSKMTLNDYVEFTYKMGDSKYRFVEEFYKIDFSVMKYLFSIEGLNIRNFYSHGNNKNSAEMKIDAFIIMGVIAKMIGSEYIEQYLEDRYSQL